MPFSDIHISQGSVATCLKHGGIFKHNFFCKFTNASISEKNWKLDNSWWSYGQEFGVLFFWLTVYMYRLAHKMSQWPLSVKKVLSTSQGSVAQRHVWGTVES